MPFIIWKKLREYLLNAAQCCDERRLQTGFAATLAAAPAPRPPTGTRWALALNLFGWKAGAESRAVRTGRADLRRLELSAVPAVQGSREPLASLGLIRGEELACQGTSSPPTRFQIEQVPGCHERSGMEQLV